MRILIEINKENNTPVNNKENGVSPSPVEDDINSFPVVRRKRGAFNHKKLGRTKENFEEVTEIEEEKEPIEWATIGAVCVIGIIILSVFGVVGWVVYRHNQTQYTKTCQTSPLLLHAEACSNAQDCMNKCVDKLKNPKGAP